jgi:hypothetical protein
MLNWDINSLNLQQEEMIKQARQDQLAQDMIEETRRANPHYNPALAWIGHRIMDFGGKLVQISGNSGDEQKDKASVYSPEVHLN